MINEDNVKIKPFFTLINELWMQEKSLEKYKKYFKTILYKKFGIPEYEYLWCKSFLMDFFFIIA